MKKGKKPVKQVLDIEKVFSELPLLLAGQNYVVFLHRYTLPIVDGADTNDYIKQKLPDAVVGEIQSCSGQEMVEEIAYCLKYAGSNGDGPLSHHLSSSKFEGLLAELSRYLTQRSAEAAGIFGFWLKDGHPDYPVFWDFAFIIVGLKNAEIIIGSSSD